MTLVSVNEVKLQSPWLVMVWVTVYEYHCRPGALGLAIRMSVGKTEEQLGYTASSCGKLRPLATAGRVVGVRNASYKKKTSISRGNLLIIQSDKTGSPSAKDKIIVFLCIYRHTTSFSRQ